ncbi:MAG: SRPBCC domain-containing protein [Solirubrobacteraceae bacterium]
MATCARDRRAARRRLRGIHLEGRAGSLLRHRRPGLDRQSECDLRVGGLWTVTFGPSPDHLYHHRSVFEIVDRPRRLVLATTEHRPDRPSFDFSVEFTFEDQDGRTVMTVIQSGFPTAELRDEHRRGVPNALARLERAIRASE